MGGYNLIFDADDTLWENNVFFERAVEAFIDYLDHPTFSRAHVRTELDKVEHANSAAYGYGARVFEYSLGECLARLRPDPPFGEEDRIALRKLCSPVLDFEIELLDGVGETLSALAERHRLLLLTKGDERDQRSKIDTSGLASMFAGIGIVAEKQPDAYREFGAKHGLDPADTWMIGNSPKSDIRPALAVGMGAVLVPHPMTWSLEHEELPNGHERFHTVSPIRNLVEFF